MPDKPFCRYVYTELWKYNVQLTLNERQMWASIQMVSSYLLFCWKKNLLYCINIWFWHITKSMIFGNLKLNSRRLGPLSCDGLWSRGQMCPYGCRPVVDALMVGCGPVVQCTLVCRYSVLFEATFLVVFWADSASTWSRGRALVYRRQSMF